MTKARSSTGVLAQILQSIGLFVGGGVVGAALFMLVYQQNFSRLVVQNTALRTENIKLSEDLEQLRRNQKNHSIIKRIDAHLTASSLLQVGPDVQEELERRVRDELKVVYGQKITTAKENVPVFEKLISSKTSYAVLDKHYAVQVKFFALIGTELTVWFSAREIHIPTPPAT